MKTRFIFNPLSGRNQHDPRLREAVRAFIAGHRLDADLVTTEAPGHATVLARTAVKDGCTRVVAIGGDGTMNEVAQALINSPAALGLVPRGSGNGLALHLGIPLAPRRALDLLIDPEAHETTIDTGSANGHPFFNVMGLGFDAEISRRFNRLTHRSLFAYVRTGWSAFREHRPKSITIRMGCQEETVRALLVAVANTDQYGNHAIIAPGARVNDGQLDLTAIGAVNFPGAVRLTTRLFMGSLNRSSHVRTLRGTQFLIRRNAPGIIHTDGEIHATNADVDVRVHPGSLRLLVPAGRRAMAPLRSPERREHTRP